jgi:hypothetical protein
MHDDDDFNNGKLFIKKKTMKQAPRRISDDDDFNNGKLFKISNVSNEMVFVMLKLKK